MSIELTNNYHGTSVRVRVPRFPALLSIRQTRRVDDTLCGIGGCCCGSIRGPQTVAIESEYNRGDGLRLWIRSFGN